MATERLYYDDGDLLSFEAKVVGHGRLGERSSVLLDRTAFYPESGGQMADRGALTLGQDGPEAAIEDVQVDEGGDIHHLIDGELPAEGTVVVGTVDRDRRRVHRALHTGQHMLSRALLEVAKGQTVSSRLGENDCNIDLDREAVSDARLSEAESLVNSVVDDDVDVRAFFPTEEELAAMDLRRTIKVSGAVRIVEVEGFDLTPCGGTHCTTTSQVGLVRILRTERVKGRLRVLFSAGPRARRQLFAEQDALQALARSFTCGPLEIEDAVERLRAERKALKQALGNTRSELAEAVAAQLLHDAESQGTDEIVAAFDGADMAFLKVVAERLTRGPHAALLAAPSDDGTLVIVARGDGSEVDCGAVLKAAAASAGGKGGGKPALAQGRLPGRVDWVDLIKSLER